jgi:opacity protein-like surface antigen
MKKSLFAAALLLAISSSAFAQVGVGGFVSFGEDIQPLNLSLTTSPSKNYGLIFRQGFGFNASQIYRRAETNLIANRRFFKTENSNFYVGLGGIMNYQRYDSQTYFDWGFNIPLGVEIFPNPEKRTFGITVETGLYYKTNKQRGTMLRDEDKFGGYGGLSLHYYFDKTK